MHRLPQSTLRPTLCDGSGGQQARGPARNPGRLLRAKETQKVLGSVDIQAVNKAFGGANGLPVAEVLESLEKALEGQRLCALQAPPGSGKTLLAPLALWESGRFSQVTVLEPRRVTARLPALALRPLCGELVGYRIRFESLWDRAKTKIGYLTYGTALRVMAETPPGPDELIIFDEFHERSWEAEYLLAQLRARDHQILLMSATLDTDSLPPEVPLVESDGRLHAVNLSWEPREPQLLGDNRKLAALIAERSAELAQKCPGEQLIFLPGMAAMREVDSVLRADSLPGPVQMLHSSMLEGEIRAVVERSPRQGFRRVLSTDLAESSVTLPGVTAVLDSGLRRQPVTDTLGLGVSLRTVRASQASLAQRAGRAGRLGPGVCHRLFTRDDELHRVAFVNPQILELDAKLLTLHLASSGHLQNWADLPWMTAPPRERVDQAVEWLLRHQLLDKSQRLNQRGRQVLRAPCGPRGALLAILGSEAKASAPELADWCCAIENGPGRTERALTLRGLLASKAWKEQRDRRLFTRIKESLPSGHKSGADLALLLTRAFPDTVAQWRADRAVLRSPEQPALELSPTHSPEHPFGVVLATAPYGRAGGPVARVTLFQPIPTEVLWEELFDELEEEERWRWDASSKSVKGSRQVKLGQLVLEKSALRAAPGPGPARILRANLRTAQFGEGFAKLARRLRLFLEHFPEESEEMESTLPDLDGADVVERLALSFLHTITTWDKSCPLRMRDHMTGMLGYELTRKLDQSLPQSVTMPARRRPVPIHYPEDGHPYLASKLQDFFGWTPPKLLGGRLPLLFHLLAPNGRPAQITHDLEGFWSGSYAQVRKDLRGRYPKHDWPENPTRRG